MGQKIPLLLLSQRHSQSGSTLVEVMIAGALVIVAATAVFPIFAQTSRMTKGSEFRELCMKAVRGKIAQYKAGNKIQAGSLSNSGALGTGIHNSIFRSGYQQLGQSNGFFFAKYIYNLRESITGTTPDCIGDINRSSMPAVYPPSPPANLGTQEAIGNITTNADEAGPSIQCAQGICGDMNSACPCSEDATIKQQLGGGFKLYVNLQRVHSFGTNGIDGGSDCPVEGKRKWGLIVPFWAQNYDFNGATDAIKITVTGLYDFNESGARTEIGGIKANSVSTGSLVCTASDILKPAPSVARYAIGRYIAPAVDTTGTLDWPDETVCSPGGSLEGRCEGAIMDLTGRPVFRALWNANNRAINVAPNNRAVYILTESGEVYRYGDETRAQQLATTCVGAPAECTTDGSADPTKTLEPATIVTIPNLISFGFKYEQMADSNSEGDNFLFHPTDFYGVVSDASGVHLVYAPIKPNEVGTDITALIAQSTPPVPLGLNKFAEPPLDLPTDPVNGFSSWMMNFRGTQAFVLAQSCVDYGSGTASTLTQTSHSFCSAIFRYEDSNNLDHAAPIERVKFNIKALSP